MQKALMLSVALLAQTAWCGGDDDKDPIIVATTLTAVREKPDAFKHVTVRFNIQFNALGKVSNPFFTRFVPSDFVNFYAWPTEQPIWRKDSYDDLFGMLFLAKENKQIQDLYKMRLYERFEIEAIVRNTFQSMPWIEVLKMKPISGKVTTATLAHLYRGEEHMKQRQWDLAVHELSLAPGEGVPDEIRSATHKNLGICYLRTGEAEKAVSQLTSALSLNGADFECQRLLEQARTRPENGLDRTVREVQPLKDYERPLWEAFENLPSGNLGNTGNMGGNATPMPNPAPAKTPGR